MHRFLMFLPLPYQVTQIAQILSYTSFPIPKKRVSQGLTVRLSFLIRNFFKPFQEVWMVYLNVAIYIKKITTNGKRYCAVV